MRNVVLIAPRHPHIREDLIKMLSLPTHSMLLNSHDRQNQKKRKFNCLLFFINVKVQENARVTRLWFGTKGHRDTIRHLQSQ